MRSYNPDGQTKQGGFEAKTLKQELKEALEQQAATSEILRMIARSPTDLQPVFDAIAEKAARLCGADDAPVRRVEGNTSRLVAHFGPIPPVAGLGEVVEIERGGVAGRAIRDRKTVHVTSVQPRPSSQGRDNEG